MKVSVIMPVYNGVDKVDRSIRSLLNQNLKDWELIVVNDGSTDNTSFSLKKWKDRLPNMKIIEMPENKGPLAARMIAIEAATSEYISFLDAGDKYVKNSLKKLIEVADSNKSDIAIGSTLIRIKNFPFRWKFYFPLKSLGTDLTINELFEAELNGKMSSSLWDKVFRTKFLKDHLPFDIGVKNLEDLYFNSMVFPHAKKVNLTNLPFYEWEYSGMGTKYFLKHFDEVVIVYEKIFSTLSTRSHKESLARGFMRHFVEGIIERLRCSKKGKQRAFIFAGQILQSDLMKIVKENLENYEGLSLDSLSPEILVDYAKSVMTRHRKFYFVTGILNRILKI